MCTDQVAQTQEGVSLLFYQLAGMLREKDDDDETLGVNPDTYAGAVQVFRGVCVCTEDMNRLKPKQKLNDELINLFMAVLAEASWVRDGPNVYCFSTHLLSVLMWETNRG